MGPRNLVTIDPFSGQGDDVVRKVMAYELLSLDEVAEEPNEFINDCDDAMRENFGRVIAPQDAMFLGRSNLRQLGRILANHEDRVTPRYWAISSPKAARIVTFVSTCQ